MKQLKIRYYLSVIGFIGLSFFIQSVHAQEAGTKIAFVSLERILSESKMAKDAQAKMQS
jgi:outer membrane protein